METKINNLYQPSNNFVFWDSDMEEESVDLKPNSDPGNKSTSDRNVSDFNDSSINPWKVENLKEFLNYCCPQCDFWCKEESEFYSHSVETHKQARIIELVSKELNHFGVIAGLFRQIVGHSSRFVLFCSF